VPKRLDLRDRECPKCGGKIGVIRRATKAEPLAMLGCVSNTHVQVQGTYGYDANDFPKKVKPKDWCNCRRAIHERSKSPLCRYYRYKGPDNVKA